MAVWVGLRVVVNENGHPLAQIFKTLVPIWEGLGGVTWLEEMLHCSQALRVLKTPAIPSALCLPPTWGLRCELSAVAAVLLPHPHGLQPFQIVS